MRVLPAGWRTRFAVLVGVLALLLAACGGIEADETAADDDAPPAPDDVDTGAGEGQVITIMVAAPLTGDAAETGQDMVDGSQLAADFLNDNGGVQGGPMQGATFEIVAVDDEMSTEASSSIASRVADDESIWALTGFMSSAQAQAAGTILEREGLGVFAAFSGADFLTDEADNIVVGTTSLDNAAAAAVDFVVAEFGAERIGYIAGDFSFLESYYPGLDRRAEELGVEIVSRQQHPAEMADFSALLTNIERDNVDVLLSGALQAQAGQIVSQARAAGLDMPIVDFVGEGWGQTYLDTAGEAALGTYQLEPFAVDPDQGTFAAEILERFEAAYGRPMSGAGMHAFDAVLSIHATLEAGAGDRSELVAFAPRTSGEGVLGAIGYTEELRPGDRAATIREIVGLDPVERRVAARYSLRGDRTVERLD